MTFCNIVFMRNAILMTILVIIAYKDFKYYLIPDRWIAFALINWIIFAIIDYAGIAAVILRLLAAFTISCALLLIVLLVERIRGRESLGGGDIKLVFAVGLYLGFWGSIYMLLIAGIIGLLMAVCARCTKPGVRDYFPFGPAISAATFLVLIFETVSSILL